MGTVSLSISALHPAFAGHFPGTPIVPGVVLLDEAVYALKQSAVPAPFDCEIAIAKFHRMVRPGEPLTLEHERNPDGSIRFAIRSLDRVVASGRLTFPADLPGADREA
jgi:3-hydroxyacyl-[acyl-carrier-protein] dehydratase